MKEVVADTPIFHFNVLFLLGLAMFGGILGGRVSQKLRIPQVVGYILIGLALGKTFLKIVDSATVTRLEPLSYFALGIIGFMVGGELKKDIFIKYGKQLTTILLWEGIMPFFLVAGLTTFACGFIFDNWMVAASIGLLFGAIASVTDPTATTAVLREFKTRGPLTRTILGIAALDDGLALILFVIASSIAGVFVGTAQPSLIKTLLYPLYEIGGALVIGIVFGAILIKTLRKHSEESRLLTFSIGTVLLTCGLALAIHVDMLLAAMTLGVVVVNFSPRKSKNVFHLIEGATPPIYVLFFILVGAKIDIRQLAPVTLLLVVLYLIGMVSGKMIGSRLGAVISGAPQTVRRYLPYAMFPQLGVSIGLAILASQRFPGEIGNTVLVVTTAATFVSQVIGPALTKYAVSGAKEVGLNITEDDLADKTIARDVMDAKPSLIYNDMHLSQILAIFSKSSNLYYPVVTKDKKVLGIITVESIRNIFMETGLSDLLLAVDLMENAPAVVTPESTLAVIKDQLQEHHVECLPVVTSDGSMQGFIEKRVLDRFIATKILELQRTADALEGVA